jgi:hypothetical protein
MIDTKVEERLLYDYEADFLPDDCDEVSEEVEDEEIEDVTDEELSAFCPQPLDDDPDYEPLDDSREDSPSCCPLFQDLPHDDPLRGRAVKCAQRICHDFFRGDDWRDREFIVNVQQEAFLYLWEQNKKWEENKTPKSKRKIRNDILDENVKEWINLDSEKFDSPRLKDHERFDVCSNGEQPRIKKTVHSLDHESLQQWETWTFAQPIYQSSRHEHVQELYDCGEKPWRIAQELNIPKRTVYRILEDNREADVVHGRTVYHTLDDNGNHVHSEKRKRPRVLWSAVPRLIKLPQAEPCPDTIPESEWPGPLALLCRDCHCEGEGDRRLVETFLKGEPLQEAEKLRLQELAWNRSNL